MGAGGPLQPCGETLVLSAYPPRLEQRICQCLGSGSLYSHGWDGKRAGLGLPDTSVLGVRTNPGSQGPVPPVAGCHPLPGPAIPTGVWPSTTRTCSSSARSWSSRSSRSSCGCSSRWVPVPGLSPAVPVLDPAPQSPSSCRWMSGCQCPCATPEHGPEPAARRGAAASAGCQREGGAALGHGADGGGQDPTPLCVSGVSGLCCNNPQC